MNRKRLWEAGNSPWEDLGGLVRVRVGLGKGLGLGGSGRSWEGLGLGAGYEDWDTRWGGLVGLGGFCEGLGRAYRISDAD